MLQMTQEETLRLINAGIAIHNADVSVQKTPYSAEDYLATGFLNEKFEQGSMAARPVNIVTQFVECAFNRIEVGSSMFLNGVEFLTKIQGTVLCIYAGPNGKLVAVIESQGLLSPIKVNFGDGFSVNGESKIRHAEVGKERKHAFLLERYHPVSLVVSAIGFASKNP